MDVAEDERVIDSLRRATRSRHDALEAMLRLGPELDLRSYVEALHGFRIFLPLWQPRVRACLPARLHGWLERGSRHRLACDDLARLDPGHVADPATLSACASLVDGIGLDGIDAAFGSLYVLEGSALGGQVIARAVRDTLGLGPLDGTAYFHGLGADTGVRWREFRAMLEIETSGTRASRAAAGAAAAQTFDALIGVFTLVRNAAAG